MTKTAVFLLVSLLTLNLSQAQDREMRNHDSFSGISVGGGVDLVVTQDKSFQVEVLTDGDLDDVITEVSRGILEIKQKSNSWMSWNDKVEVRVSLPMLEYLNASGGSDVENRGTLHGDFLEIKASGGSDVELEISYERLEIDCSGGSDVELAGNAMKLELESSGGSDFDGADLIVQEADVNSSGGSDARIRVNKRIYARASGASDITYYGSPEYVDVNSSGGADVRGGR